MGGANLLAEAFPYSRIRAFAMIRVISDPGRFVHLKDPCTGTVTMRGEYTNRSP